MIAQFITPLPSNSRKMSSQGVHTKLVQAPVNLFVLPWTTWSIQVTQNRVSGSVSGALPSCASACTQQGFDSFAQQHLPQANPIPHLTNTQFSPTDISLLNCCPILLIENVIHVQCREGGWAQKGCCTDLSRQPALQKEMG